MAGRGLRRGPYWAAVHLSRWYAANERLLRGRVLGRTGRPFRPRTLAFRDLIDLSYAEALDEVTGLVDKNEVRENLADALGSPIYDAPSTWGMAPAALRAQAAMEEAVPMATPRVRPAPPDPGQTGTAPEEV